MGLIKKRNKISPLPIIVKLTPKFPIIFERIPFPVEIEVWNRTSKAYRDSYIDIGLRPIERPGSVIPVKVLKLGPIPSQSRIKKKIRIICPYTGKYIPATKLYFIEKEIKAKDSKVSWTPWHNGKLHVYHVKSTVVVEERNGTVKYYEGQEISTSSSEIKIHSLVELLILVFSFIAATASLLNLLLKSF